MIEIEIGTLLAIDDILQDLNSGSLMNKVLGPSLLQQAKVARDFARRPNRRRSRDNFRDRTPAERAAAGFPGARGLRKSIRAVGAPAYYGGRRYVRGRAIVSSGGRGARQAFLVHDGHGGPWPARPYRFLRRAINETDVEGLNRFVAKAREEYNKEVARQAARSRVRSRGNIFATSRTVSRRARRR